MVESSSAEDQKHRKELLEDRAKEDKPSSAPQSRGAAARVEQIEISSDEADTEEFDTDEDDYLDDLYDNEYDDPYDDDVDMDDMLYVPGNPEVYYGGYGSCFNCGARGHWSNGCPLRNHRNT